MSAQDAIEFGRFNDARVIMAEQDDRVAVLTGAINHLIKQAKDFVEHIPDMTPAEWQQAGLNTGNFVGREAMQVQIISTGLSGLGKIGQGIAESAENLTTTTWELALAGQFMGEPTAQSIGRLHRIENVYTHIGSRQISGIPALHPELVKRVIMNEGGQLIEVATQAIADGTSTAASHAATILQLGKQLGCSLSEAKPGFIDLGGGEQKTTETNSPSSLSSNSSSIFVAF